MKKKTLFALMTAVVMMAVSCGKDNNDDPAAGTSGTATEVRDTTAEVQDTTATPTTDEAFPAGTGWIWEYAIDSTFSYYGLEVGVNISFSIEFDYRSTGDSVDMNAHIQSNITGMPFPVNNQDENYRTSGTYTYDSDAKTGTMYLIDADEPTAPSDVLPFVYNSTDNTIIVDLPEDFYNDDDDEDEEGNDEGDDEEEDDPISQWLDNLQLPEHLVFRMK